ncbi:hypothetical protein ACFLU5_02190 [Bacteroidota bacterium]
MSTNSETKGISRRQFIRIGSLASISLPAVINSSCKKSSIVKTKKKSNGATGSRIWFTGNLVVLDL